MSDLEFLGRVPQNPERVTEDRYPYLGGKQARLIKAAVMPALFFSL
jgi:hypothetical protein